MSKLMIWQQLAPCQLPELPAFNLQPGTLCGTDYPTAQRQALHAAGVSRLLADAPENVDALLAGEDVPSQVTMWHAAALNHRLATIDGSLAITVGVNYLAFIPLYITGTADQLRRLGACVQNGAYGSIGLTEIAHGSNLLANETLAAPDGVHYRLTGEKQLINGASKHELLTILARTGPAGPRAFSLLWCERDATVSAPKRWHTLPMPNADISSVRFDGTRADLLGRTGRGFALVQKTMTMTRGGISVWAAGLANRAVELAIDYSQTRQVRQAPILHLNPIADHLLQMRALDLLISALSLKTSAMLNRYGPAAVMHASAAKVICCTLAEQLVTEGRYLHGARALLTDYPYHALVRDVLLYATFDGTVHVVLDQLQTRLAQLAAQPNTDSALLPIVQSAYSAAPRSIVQASRQSARPLFIDPRRYLAELAAVARELNPAPLQTLAVRLFERVEALRTSGEWDADQSLRLEMARHYGLLEALIALVEVGDRGCREALGMQQTTAPAPPLLSYVLNWGCERLAYALQHEQLSRHCRTLMDEARQTLLDNRSLLTEI